MKVIDGPVHISLFGDYALSQQYIPLAKTLLGITKILGGRMPNEPPDLNGIVQGIFGDRADTLAFNGNRYNTNRGWDKQQFQSGGPLWAPPDRAHTWRFKDKDDNDVVIECLAGLDIDRVRITTTPPVVPIEELVTPVPPEEEETEGITFILMVQPSVFETNYGDELNYCSEWCSELYYTPTVPIENFTGFFASHCYGDPVAGHPCSEEGFCCRTQNYSPDIWLMAPMVPGYLAPMGGSGATEYFGVEFAPYELWATGDPGITERPIDCHEFEDVLEFDLEITGVADWPDDPSTVTPPVYQLENTGTWHFCFQTDKCGEYRALWRSDGADCGTYLPNLNVEITEPWQFPVFIYNFWGPNIHWFGFPCEGSTLPDPDLASGIATCAIPFVKDYGPGTQCWYYLVNDWQEGSTAGENIAQIGDCNSRLTGGVSGLSYSRDTGRETTMADQCVCFDLLREEIIRKPNAIPTTEITGASRISMAEQAIAISMNPTPVDYPDDGSIWNIQHFYSSVCVREAVRNTVTRCVSAGTTHKVAIISWAWTSQPEDYTDYLVPFVAQNNGIVVLVAGIVSDIVGALPNLYSYFDARAGQLICTAYSGDRAGGIGTYELPCRPVFEAEARASAVLTAQSIAGGAEEILLTNDQVIVSRFNANVYLVQMTNIIGSNQFYYIIPDYTAVAFWPTVYAAIMTGIA